MMTLHSSKSNKLCAFVGGVPNVLPGVLRDFSTHHDDFGFDVELLPSSPALAKPPNAQTGAVNSALGAGRKPVWTGSPSGSQYFTNEQNFNSWFNSDDATCSPVSPANTFQNGQRTCI